jgi:hypothetical protein
MLAHGFWARERKFQRSIRLVSNHGLPAPTSTRYCAYREGGQAGTGYLVATFVDQIAHIFFTAFPEAAKRLSGISTAASRP